MEIPLFEEMAQRGVISPAELTRIRASANAPVSVFWDFRTLLYIGVVLLTSAVAILVYKNINTIGHQAILMVIASLCITGYAYCIKHSNSYSNKRVVSPGNWFDYILLTACLFLLTFTGYIQYEYAVFGNRWGLALFLPMIILFVAAYYFDHLGVLSLAITNFAAWAGITVTPMKILQSNDFNDTRIIYTGIVIGVLLVAISFMVEYKNVKAHFSFTYRNFGAHILFVSLLALMFYFDHTYLATFVILLAIAFLFFRNALKQRSFYFLVITALYTYAAFSYVVIKLLLLADFDTTGIYLGITYFIISGISLIKIFIKYNNIINKNAGLP